MTNDERKPKDEPRTSRTVPPTRCCRRLVGRAVLRFLCRQDSGSPLGILGVHFRHFSMHWDPEPIPNPSQEGSSTELPVPLLGGVWGEFVAVGFMKRAQRSGFSGLALILACLRLGVAAMMAE